MNTPDFWDRWLQLTGIWEQWLMLTCVFIVAAAVLGMASSAAASAVRRWWRQ